MRKPKLPPPCFSFLKAEMIEADKGAAIVRFIPSEEMENPFGLIQGGILAGMVDNVIGPAVVSAVPDRQTSTIQMSVNFLAPARPGERILGTARVVRLGRTQAYIEAELVRESDKTLLLRASATNIFLSPSNKEKD